MYQGNMYSGGQGVYLFYLTRELARMGHEVHVIAGPPYPQLDERVVTHNITDYSYWTYHHYKKDFVFNRPPLSYFHPVNFYEFISTRIALSSLLANYSVRAYFKLRELAREHRFDVVHDNQTLSYGVWATHASGFPLVATIHHPLSYDLKNQLRQARSMYEKARRILWSPWMMQEWAAKSVDRVIVVSETSRVDVEEAFQLPPEKVRTVYNGIDVDTFRPLPGVEVKVLGPDNEELPPNTPGEFCFRCSTFMIGYWNKPELSAQALRGGWLHSGDIGIVDDDGELFVRDRLKDIIISSGNNIYPKEVENALCEHEAVQSAAAIGVPDEIRGELVHAFVVLKPGEQAGAQDLIAHCATIIGKHKLPRDISFVNELPLTASGKIQRFALREMLAKSARAAT